MLASIALAGVVVVAVVFLAVRGPGAKHGTNPGDFPDLIPPGARDATLLGGQPQPTGASGLFVQVMDRNDPTRLAGELRSRTVQPTNPGRYHVGTPRAWMFLKDGRAVHVEANEGTLYMPDRSREPESGRFVGSVVIRLFEMPADGTRPDIDSDEPALTARTESLTFDFTLGEVSTPDRLLLNGQGVEFAGSDVKILVNQVLERLEVATVARGEYLRVDPAERARSTARMRERREAAARPEPAATRAEADARPGATVRADRAAGTPPPPPASEPAPAVEPKESFYHALFQREVVLTQGSQSVRGDRMSVWTRLLDNRLPEDAIGEPRKAEPAPTPPPRVTPREGTGEAVVREAPKPQADRPPEAQTPAAVPVFGRPAADGPAELTWTGPLEIRPLADRPPTLAEDHVAARITAEETGVVQLADTESGGTGRAAQVDYAATRRVVVLSGQGQEGVLLEQPGESGGSVRVGRLELPLDTGVAVARGSGVASSMNGLSRIDWGERADLWFMVRDGTMTGELLRADFVGKVRAAEEDASLEADLLRAVFEPNAPQAAGLRSIDAIGAAVVNDGKGGGGGPWDRLRIDFVANEAGDGVDPVRVTAEGNGRFRQNDAEVRARAIDADLTTDDRGAVVAQTVSARGEVRFSRRSDRLRIEGESLWANLDEQRLEVAGDGTLVEREGTRITGDEVRLDGTRRTATSLGAGTFEHRTRNPGEPPTRTHAEWAAGMTFDDRTGILEATGDVVAISEPDPVSRDTIRAERVRVELEPAPEGEAVTLDSTDPAAQSRSRRVLRMHAWAAPPEADDDTVPIPASVESTRSIDAGPDAPPRLARAFTLFGHEIIADNTAGTLDVPGAGRLMVADLRADTEAGSNDGNRGTALFDWSQSFHVDQAKSEATMHGGVRLSHRRLADSLRTDLEAESITARIRNASADEAGDLSGELEYATAVGKVWVRSGRHELTGHRLEYDAIAGTAEAFADEGGVVTVVEVGRTSPVTARRIFWNLVTDRIEVREPGPARAPR
ncbi:MAG: hypothetical protein DYG93_03830 [Leptolyngbya sp. PLA2]|nr:hypothetical protein [Leptolyngbya sp.]MCE7970783.1 hypothetical protein [Leptolyngbya sp. PL-A2]MCQ3939938.1 hypothetical protein [cyanobacterium CYA1]GIK18011.1 MAG: hypothetical protein BroJett004_01750 [Planctomycetota bacterium]